MKLYVISGGGGTGKTTLINSLSGLGYFVLEEAARKIALNDKRFIEKNTREINMQDFQHAIIQHQKKELEELQKNNKIVFSDRGMGDTLAFMNYHKVKIPTEYFNYAKKFSPEKIFILNPLKSYKKDSLRQESEEEMKLIHEEIIKTYKELKQNIVFVPFAEIRNRLDFILENIQNL